VSLVATGASLIEIENVDKFYRTRNDGELQALDKITFNVRDREFLSILGPSGCGKSTLLRIVDGLTPYEGGAVTIDGQPVTGPGPDRAVVFQNFALLPWATVLDNVCFPLEARGVRAQERRARARDVLEQVGLTDFEDHYPRTLSGGMQQRVGLARALVVDPRILLMDEPFGALDALTRTFLQDELLKLWSRDRKTVVFVTHAIDEAVYLSDRVVVMSPRPGRVAEIVDVPIDRDRGTDVRDTPEFHDLVSHLRRVLREFVHDDPEAE
jgi:NitT/TauT family transport system ATP-binding protein